MMDPASPTPIDEPCELLAWDSAFFGLTVAKVRADGMTPAIADEVDIWCREKRVQWLYFLSNGQDPSTARCAEQRGYKLVDIRMTVAREISDGVVSPSPIVVPFIDADLPALHRIAATSFTASRFYYDGRIPKAKCEELFIFWTTRECRGIAEQVLVAHREAEPVGYVTCHIDPTSSTASIGLLGVEQQSRGKGVGQALVDSALAWAAEHKLRRMTVVTQARNEGARRLYERCGFASERAQNYFHKWYD